MKHKKPKICASCGTSGFHDTYQNTGIGRLYYCDYSCQGKWDNDAIGTFSHMGETFIRNIAVRVVAQSRDEDIHDPKTKPIVMVEADILYFDKMFNKGVTRRTEWLVYEEPATLRYAKPVVREQKTYDECNAINAQEMCDRVAKILEDM